MQRLYFPTIEEVVAIHDRLIEIGGGSPGIRDIGLLHSAVERPKTSFAGKYLYSSLFQMGASLLYSLANNHAFVDGNKRIAFFTALRFFDKNEITFIIKNNEIVSFMVNVVENKLEIEDIEVWFKQYQVT